MTYSLIIDTSNYLLVVGLLKDKEVLGKVSYKAFQRQSEFAIKEIDKLCKDNGIEPKDISKIFVTIGPGSYTGIRIGLTIAKVMNVVNNALVYPVSSLLALIGDKEGIGLIDARNNRCYMGIYKNGKCMVKDCVLSNVEALEIINNYPGYEYYGDAHIFNKEDKVYDLVYNVISIMDELKPCTDVDALVPAYLKEAL